MATLICKRVRDTVREVWNTEKRSRWKDLAELKSWGVEESMW